MTRLVVIFTMSVLTFLKASVFQDSSSVSLDSSGKNTRFLLPDSVTQVTVPAGKFAFADSVILYDPGAPGRETGDEPDKKYQKPENALGLPDMQSDSGFVSLGRGGTIILKFSDNCIIDKPGPDLSIFMKAEKSESAKVWVSRKGRFYQFAGIVDSKNTLIDLEGKVSDGIYQFVKIRDASENSPDTSGALGIDIDAVCALNSMIIKTIPGDSLFSPFGSTIKDTTCTGLREVVGLIKSHTFIRVIIQSFSDSRGTDEFKLMLTQQQAAALRDYFVDDREVTNAVFEIMGMGKQSPVASGDSDYARQKNRRIKILIYPEK